MIDVLHIVQDLKKASGIAEFFLVTDKGRSIKRLLDGAITDLMEMQGEIEEQQRLSFKWVSKWTMDKVPNRSLDNLEKIVDALDLSGKHYFCKAEGGCACSGNCVNQWVTDNEFLMRKVVRYIEDRTSQMHLPKENIFIVEERDAYIIYHKDLLWFDGGVFRVTVPELLFKIKDGRIVCASDFGLPKELEQYA